MSLKKDHHELVAEVVKLEDLGPPLFLGVLLTFAFLGFLGWAWSEGAVLQGYLVVFVGTVAGYLLGQELLRRHRQVLVRLSHEYLVIEDRRLLGGRDTTRLALRHIRDVQVRRSSLVVQAHGFATIEIPCASSRLREQLQEAIRQAIATAPGPELRKTERAPEALEQLRAERRKESV